jgi:hypothetical protein
LQSTIGEQVYNNWQHLSILQFGKTLWFPIFAIVIVVKGLIMLEIQSLENMSKKLLKFLAEIS